MVLLVNGLEKNMLMQSLCHYAPNQGSGSPESEYFEMPLAALHSHLHCRRLRIPLMIVAMEYSFDEHLNIDTREMIAKS